MVYVYLRSLYRLLSLIPNQINIFYNPKIIVQITFIFVKPELGHGLSQPSPWYSGPESAAYADVRAIGFVHRLSWTVPLRPPPPNPNPSFRPCARPRAPTPVSTSTFPALIRSFVLSSSFFFGPLLLLASLCLSLVLPPTLHTPRDVSTGLPFYHIIISFRLFSLSVPQISSF